VRLSLVLHAFLVRTAVGTLVSLVVVMWMRAAERHVRFQTVLATVLAAGAAALYLPALGDDVHPDFPRGADAFLSLSGGAPGLLVAFCAACLAANFLFGTFRRGPARLAVFAGIAVGAVAVLGTARLAPGGDAGSIAGRAVGGLLGGAVMGGVNDAMILGHFYLMIRGLPLEALHRTGIAAAASVLVRAAFFAGVCVLWGGASDVLFGPRELIWTCWRIAFGFVGPLALIWMTRDALKYRHTQAATGILYVAVAFVLMGELAAVYLEFDTGLPV
jgi:hypothetical protein